MPPQTLSPTIFASAIARSAARSRYLVDADVAVSSVLAVNHGVIAAASAETMGLNIAEAERRSMLRIAKQALTSGKLKSRAKALDTAADAWAALFAIPLHNGYKIIGALAIALPQIRSADADALGAHWTASRFRGRYADWREDRPITRT